jgi:hypothetical protein
MSSNDRQQYLTATVLDQDFLDQSQDNLSNQLEMICTITPFGSGDVINVSDRNKYVGSTFYEARMQFPVISRTIGEWLRPELEFSTISFKISNVDGEFNDRLPGGNNYKSWIGWSVEIKLGLRDVEATYFTIFKGKVTEIGGFNRTTTAIEVVARDDFDKLNRTFPAIALTDTAYPNIEQRNLGKLIPTIYGDWSESAVDHEGETRVIEAFIVNGNDSNVFGGTRENVECVISSHALDSIDVGASTTANVIRSGDLLLEIENGDIANVAGDNSTFEIVQNGARYHFEKGDTIFVAVKGKPLSAGTYDDNPVAQAKDILKTYGGAIEAEFDSNWNAFRDKAAPAESAISLIKSRVYVNSEQSAIKYALSILEQIRIEAFISREQLIRINSLHLDDFVAPASATFKVRNFDIERGSFKLKIDDRNNFNRAKGFYDYNPTINQEIFETNFFKNSTAVNDINGREITKGVAFPNIYIKSDVENQVSEILKLTGGYLEHIETNLTWRSTLLDIGDFLNINVNIGSTIIQDAPILIRGISYSSQGMKLPVSMWSLQMIPFSGYTPTFTAGLTGGTSATIVEET